MCADNEKGCYILLYSCIQFFSYKTSCFFHLLSLILFQICPSLTFSLLINDFVGVTTIIVSEVKIYTVFMFGDEGPGFYFTQKHLKFTNSKSYFKTWSTFFGFQRLYF